MLKLDELNFEEQEENVRITIYNKFYTNISRDEIEEAIGNFKIEDTKIIAEKKDIDFIEKNLLRLFSKYKRELKSKITGKNTILIDEDSGIPLIGLNFIGIIDKGSEMIEIKPITNCNASCAFCSVNEGPNSKKENDFVVEKDYLVNETRLLLEYKRTDEMSIWINPHGEPTLYPKLSGLVSDLLKDTHVKDIHIVTNGILLDKELVDNF